MPGVVQGDSLKNLVPRCLRTVLAWVRVFYMVVTFFPKRPPRWPPGLHVAFAKIAYISETIGSSSKLKRTKYIQNKIFLTQTMLLYYKKVHKPITLYFKKVRTAFAAHPNYISAWNKCKRLSLPAITPYFKLIKYKRATY